MKKKLAKYIDQHQLLKKGDRVLIAASAGVDSTVLCHLFKDLSLDFGMAHCNFRLRGSESDQDEIFIRNLANKMEVPFYNISFDTEKYAETHKISIQMAARELRYNWLTERVLKEFHFDKIATAHHLDDNIETVLFHFTKGTGIKGMRGMLPGTNHLIRPLLFASKRDILEYAASQGIAYREDSSNASDKYTRNKIRQQVTPVLESINPSFQQSAGETIRHLREAEQLYNFAIEHFRKSLIKPVINPTGIVSAWKINIRKLLQSPAPATVLFELLHPYGFNSDQIDQILHNLADGVGRFFYTPTHQLLVDRISFILHKNYRDADLVQIAHLAGQSDFVIPGGKLAFREPENIPSVFSTDRNTACLDAGKIQWPLTLRHWRDGDAFRPLGMGGQRKKLQDFFTDQKLSRIEKDKVWIMESGGKICWVVGYRIDERFKVSAKTTHCLLVEFVPGNYATT